MICYELELKEERKTVNHSILSRRKERTMMLMMTTSFMNKEIKYERERARNKESWLKNLETRLETTTDSEQINIQQERITEGNFLRIVYFFLHASHL